MTITTPQAERLQEIIFSAFDGLDEDALYTPEGLIAKSAVILVWALERQQHPSMLTQIGECIDHLYDNHYITREDLQEAFSILAQ